MQWLVGHPHDLSYVVSLLRLPLPKCEGHGGPCEGLVVHQTRAMTAYEWDGTGENPNRDQQLCVECSAAYQSDWEERWREYYSGCL